MERRFWLLGAPKGRKEGRKEGRQAEGNQKKGRRRRRRSGLATTSIYPADTPIESVGVWVMRVGPSRSHLFLHVKPQHVSDPEPTEQSSC